MNPFTQKPNLPVLYITTDYELFLGTRSGTIAKCLLEPTDHLAELVERYNRRLILFVDVFFLNRLNRDALEDSELAGGRDKVRSQLRRLIQRGHHVGVHTHPQWLKAVRDGQEWSFAQDAPYLLQELPQQDATSSWNTVEGALQRGKEELESLAHEVLPEYKIGSFRAGGLCLQPFLPLAQALLKNHLTIDSSIAPGCILNDGPRHFDYRQSPDKDSWPFDKDPLEELANGPFAEMPVATFRAGLRERLRNRVKRILAGRAVCSTWGDGVGRPMPKAGLLKRLMTSPMTVLSYDYWDASAILKYLKKERREGKRQVTLLGHPKYLSPFGLIQLEKVLQSAARDGWA